jgi:hypothetical protein
MVASFVSSRTTMVTTLTWEYVWEQVGGEVPMFGAPPSAQPQLT